jgi:hypothetical protein
VVSFEIAAEKLQALGIKAQSRRSGCHSVELALACAKHEKIEGSQIKAARRAGRYVQAETPISSGSR